MFNYLLNIFNTHKTQEGYKGPFFALLLSNCNLQIAHSPPTPPK